MSAAAGASPTSLSRTRYLAGGTVWLLTLQFFIVEAVAAARYPGYSRSGQVISDLGTADSPAAGLMNASFTAQGLLIAAGAVLLFPGLVGLGGRLAVVFLSSAALGVLLVGLAPSDTAGAVHTVGAVLYLLGGGLGLIALAYGVRPRSEAVGTTLALLGLVGVVTTIFFGAAVYLVLGQGGMERAAAYVVPIGLPVAALLLLRQRDDWVVPAAVDGVPLTRRQRREAERAEGFDRARERDEALEALARQREQQRQAGTAPATTQAAQATPASQPARSEDDPTDWDSEDVRRSPRRRD